MRQPHRPTGACTLPVIDSRSVQLLPESEHSNSCGIELPSEKTARSRFSALMVLSKSIYVEQMERLWPIFYWKPTMISIKALDEYIRLTHPDATTDLTPPLHSEGIWSLDVDLADKHLAIQWSQVSGFGISNTSKENFAEGPDEVFASLEQAQRRVGQLLTTIERTSPPVALLLSRLRERRGLTQRELADRLGVRQATISGLEHRGDVQLSTLRRVLNALGGVLEVFGSFPDARYRIDGPSLEASHRRLTPGCIERRPTNRCMPHDGAYESLRKAGTLPRAHEIADAISARHAVIEIP